MKFFFGQFMFVLRYRMRHKQELELRRAEMEREREEALAQQVRVKRLQVCPVITCGLRFSRPSLSNDALFFLLLGGTV